MRVRRPVCGMALIGGRRLYSQTKLIFFSILLLSILLGHTSISISRSSRWPLPQQVAEGLPNLCWCARGRGAGRGWASCAAERMTDWRSSEQCHKTQDDKNQNTRLGRATAAVPNRAPLPTRNGAMICIVPSSAHAIDERPVEDVQVEQDLVHRLRLGRRHGRRLLALDVPPRLEAATQLRARDAPREGEQQLVQLARRRGAAHRRREAGAVPGGKGVWRRGVRGWWGRGKGRAAWCEGGQVRRRTRRPCSGRRPRAPRGRDRAAPP